MQNRLKKVDTCELGPFHYVEQATEAGQTKWLLAKIGTLPYPPVGVLWEGYGKEPS